MLASNPIDRAKEVLQDTGSTTWTEAQLIEWLNDAQRVVVSQRPDASAVTASLPLAVGTKQSVPTGGLKLLDVVRNMGGDGATPGRAITLADKSTLDQNAPNWHSDAQVASVKSYVFDENNDPTVFYVTPPADGTTQIEIVYSDTPANVTALDDDVSVADTYAPALIEWMLYRAFSRESIKTPSYQRSLNHLKNFFNLLGVKMQADVAFKPMMGGDA
jgi:hypothetical protein